MYATATHVQQSHFLPQPSLPNGHAYSTVLHHQSPPQPPPPPNPPPPQPQRASAQQQTPAKEPIVVSAVPAVSIQFNRLVVGNAQSSSTRSYTPLKVLGDGSFGTVWLCDWHGTLPPNTPLSPMQCGAGARPEWVGKRLVAVKRMKKKWEGGWNECKKLKELESLRAIPFHPNIIPLYDFFLLPTTKELYFVFESMEGNLYHLIKARKGRPLAGGLVSFIFRQILSGLDHIHSHGYFHRDMKPENVLVTTTGLFDYQSVSPLAPPNAPPERDVVAIIKLADFGLARETKSEPPYTEYVSTRWYRAPEVLLLSRDYSNPVDMWALGTIVAELVNLRPMFPGAGQIEQIHRICEILGDPSDDYGFDKRNRPVGGGKWIKGLKMAKAVGFTFPKTKPKEIYTLFERTVPRSLIDCVNDLLRYDPLTRLTSRQCLEHPYLLETIPRNDVPLPKGLHLAPLPFVLRSQLKHSLPPTQPAPPHQLPPVPPLPSQIQAPTPQLPTHIPDASSTHRTPFFPNSLLSASSPVPRNTVPNPSVYPVREAYGPDASLDVHVMGDYDHPMDALPSKETTDDGRGRPTYGQPMDIQESPVLPARSHDSDLHNGVNKLNGNDVQPQANNKLSKLVPFGSKKSSKWGLGGMFGHGDKSQALPPVDEIPAGSSTMSLKRTQSSSTDGPSASEASPLDVLRPVDVKKLKKEAERMHREAEIQRRALAEKAQREQARAVMQKRNQMLQNTTTTTPDLEWKWHTTASMIANTNWAPEPAPKAKVQTRPVRQTPAPTATATATINGTHPPAGVPVVTRIVTQTSELHNDNMRRDNERSDDSERVAKARRRQYDDDHSMSASDVQRNVRRMSSTSFATVDSDPGPRGRNRPGMFPMSRMTSTSSLRTSFDTHEFLPSTRSSNSISLENQLVNDFHNLDPSSPLSGSVSPPPVHTLSISPPLSPRPSWVKHTNGNASPLLRSQPHFNHNVMSRSAGVSQHSSLTSPTAPPSPFEFGSQLSGSPNTLCQPPSPGYAPKSAINPIFKVPPLPPLPSLVNGDCLLPPLPPCSHLEAVAEGEYPPLSPIHFSTTDNGLL